MTILDTFVLVYQADAKDAKKGMEDIRKEGKKTAEELKAVDQAAYKMGESIGKGLRQLGAAAAGYLALRGLSQSFMNAVDAADKLDETAERLDVSIETLSMWGDAAKEAGGSTEGLVGSVEAFNGMLAMMEVTGKSRAAPFLKELGIDLDNVAYKGKTAFELLPEIAKAMEGMGKQEGAAIARKLGLDSGTIMLLQKGGMELDALLKKQKELGVVTKLQGELAAKWNDQLDDSAHALRTVWLQISTAVLPALTWLAKKFEELFRFMSEHKDFIIGLFIGLGSVIAVFVVPSLLSMAAAALLALAPFILIGAAVAAVGVAFALVYDDIMNFIDGNDSLIGQFLESYPQIAAIIYGIGDVFKWLLGVVNDITAIMGATFRLTFEAISTVIVGIFSYWKEQLSFVGEAFGALGQVISGIITYWIDLIGQFLNKFGGIVGIAKSISGAISGVLGTAKDALGIKPPEGMPRMSDAGGGGAIGAYGVPGMPQAKQQLSAAGSSKVPNTTSNSIRNSAMTTSKTTTVTTGPITVHTQATDPKATGEAVAKGLKDHISSANNDFDDGVVA